MSPRWRKVIADLISNPSRSVLVVLCIAIGVIAVGLIEGAREILGENLAASYQAALPATITLSVSLFDDSLLTVVRRMEGVQAAEGRTQYSVRVRTNDGTWRDVLLFAAKDLAHARVNRLLTVEGANPPSRDRLYWNVRHWRLWASGWAIVCCWSCQMVSRRKCRLGAWDMI